MGIILKLECGRDALDINSGRYCIEDSDFAPPTTARAVTYGSLVAGADAIAKRRENREWSFTINITAAGNASISEAERALRNLQTFLNRAGVHDPLYVAYRSFDDYSYEPYFGQFGAFTRYEVVHASAQAQGNYSRPLIGSNVIYGVRVTLVIKPQALGKWQASGQAIGGVFEDYIGSEVWASKGTRVPSSTTNKMTNPVFGASTWNTGWTAVNVIAEENRDRAFILFGDSSARIISGGFSASPGFTFTQSINVGNTNTHVLSFYAKRIDGNAVDANTLTAYYSTSQTTTYVSLGNGWYKCYASFSGIAAGTATGLQMAGNGLVYVDGFQIEQATEPSTFCYGDLLDCAWTGTKHASTSTRTAARLRYDYDDVLETTSGYTLRMVWQPMYTNYSRDAYLFDTDDSTLRVWIDSSERYNFQTSTGSSIQSTGVSLSASTPEIIHFTFDGATARTYRNGSLLDSGATNAATAKPTWLYVASENDATNQLGGTVADVGTFKRAMSAAEISADYTQIRYQAADGDRLSPLPWVFTEDGDNVVDNDNDGTLFCYAVVGGLMGDDIEIALKLDGSTVTLSDGFTFGSLPVPYVLFDKDILTDGGTNTLLFENGTGTSDTAANANNVKRISLSTATTTLLETAISLRAAEILREADNLTGYFVAKDAATLTNVQVRLSVEFGGSAEAFTTDWRTLATTATSFRPFVTFELPLDFEDYILDSSRKMGFKIEARRTAGASTQNLDVSHAIWLLNYAGAYTDDITAGLDSCYIRDRVIEFVDQDTSTTRTAGRRTMNRPIYIRPDRLNVLMIQGTFDNYAASKTTWDTGKNLEIEQFGTRPRWDIY